MKRAVFTLLLTLLTFLPVSADDWPIQRVKQSLVHLLVDHPEEPGKKGTCTGFAVDPGRYLTAGHCATGAVESGEVKFDVLEVSPITDIALLQADVVIPHLGITEAKEGNSYLAVGYPTGLKRPVWFPMVYQGEFEVPGKFTPDSVFVGAPMRGMSGGPIIDKRGAAVGVITGGYPEGTPTQNISYGSLYKEMFRMVMKWRSHAQKEHTPNKDE